MPNRFELRIFILCVLAAAVFLGIQVYEPYLYGTEDAYVWDYYQGMIYPAIVAFIITLAVCGFGKCKPWFAVLWNVMIGWIICTMEANDLWWGVQLAVIFYGIPSGIAAVIYLVFGKILEIGEKHADEMLKNCEESDTSNV